MIANSNDGCIILDGVTANEGDVHTFIEIDGGTEENNEECGFLAGCAGLPGGDASPDNPICPCGPEGNSDANQPDGEGFMSYHDGLGKANGGLLRDSDWRARMVQAVVTAP